MTNARVEQKTSSLPQELSPVVQVAIPSGFWTLAGIALAGWCRGNKCRTRTHLPMVSERAVVLYKKKTLSQQTNTTPERARYR
jgi:hypothetical protein